MKPFLIFLDLDGVLVTRKCTKTWISIALPYGAYRHTNLCFDENPVSLFLRFLKDLSKYTEFNIILSSSWRYENPEESTRELFTRYNIPQYVSTTPYRHPETQGIRGQEILWWLKHNNAEDHPFLVIDDEMFPIEKHIEKKHLVHVQGGWHSNGFNTWHYKHALSKAQKQLGVELTYKL